MKIALTLMTVTALALQVPASAAHADTKSDQAAAAALAILGVAALMHNKHHYQSGYAPGTGEATAEFERGYRDATHGYNYDEYGSTQDYAQGYEAGIEERTNANAYRRNNASGGNGVPSAVISACTQLVAKNYAVGIHHVHVTNSYQKSKHEYVVETAVGHGDMVCTAKDSGEIIDLRGK
ncbi:hypothetical protein [Neotabrizicola shimadae]|uniref:Uncharacterized protein n=1 Tax=Neotabrizicola shimadae TaxID=2807096 RepID=A0A8G1EBX6_9RHOB|nr:hypothetical protein [Neotabrizicola shimadae]QYZ70075.1 hypothetical protein JO391_00590 [Neotabrizicola shimadae]